jgi:hypothetical protein
MTEELLKQEIERLKKENEELKTFKGGKRQISMKVSAKGALSVYGLGRFPITLYKEQWNRLLEVVNDIKSFIKAHEGELKTK